MKTRRTDREQRTTTLTIRLSPAERQRLDSQAEAAATTVSGWARQVLLGVPPRRKRKSPDREAIRQLQAAGNNLNQLTRIANTTGKLPDRQALKAALAQLRKAIDEVAHR